MRHLNLRLYAHRTKGSASEVSAARRKQLGKTNAAKTDARTRAAMEEITAAYEPEWPLVQPDPAIGKQSRTGVARWLVRTGRVTGFNHETNIIRILEMLEAQGKITLPPKTGKGGARKKKK
ncbi:MAG: hypothetical protein Q8N60_02390 [Candidatus Diapherotrites archaeon]|nr:hypothetical protein [Candidatus Diapherotrites archaeon]